jgi:hypothetical protein
MACIGTVEMTEMLSEIYQKYGTDTFTQHDLVENGLAGRSHVMKWKNKRFLLMVQKPKKGLPRINGHKIYKPAAYKLSGTVIALIERWRKRNNLQ